MARAITPSEPQTRDPDDVLTEVVDPRMADVEAVARWLDYAFVLPGGFRYGLGGIIGLIPGLGDIVDALFSLYIVVRAVQLGVPRVTLTRMLVNVGIETAAGMVPFLGAVFDTVFKANRRNYRLLRGRVSGARNQTARNQTAKDWLFLVVTGVVILTAVAIPIVVVLELAKHL